MGKKEGKNNIKIMKKIRCYAFYHRLSRCKYRKFSNMQGFSDKFFPKRQNKDCTTMTWPRGGHDCEVFLIWEWVIVLCFCASPPAITAWRP